MIGHALARFVCWMLGHTSAPAPHGKPYFTHLCPRCGLLFWWDRSGDQTEYMQRKP